jgi:ATP-dependent Clp protease protease subunit
MNVSTLAGSSNGVSCVQLVPAVTELVISELLWLNFHNPEKHIYVYLNSMGSQQPDGQSVGFEAEAYAILDMLAYIKPEVRICSSIT